LTSSASPKGTIVLAVIKASDVMIATDAA